MKCKTCKKHMKAVITSFFVVDNRKAENRPLMKVICSLHLPVYCLSALMISYYECFLINGK